MNFKYICITICFIFTIFNLSNSTFTPVECDFCTLAVDSLHNIALADNLTYADIDGALGRICNSIPSNYSGLCNYVLEAMGPTVIKQVLNGTRSEIVCTELTICSNVNLKNKNSICQNVETALLTVAKAIEDISELFNESTIIQTVLKVLIEVNDKITQICSN
ncbi:hypothetical protein DDB_G0270248 [Dictyostelium discoideum AX4]|uniref:Saposin B-type domain-containing protein n=1 Tax=Dictyostelium discoideum TaxID=44689 RepID=Q55C30_DICDI|nr:hypothetical protein DDB_G0270248 [Dictyostelium discoideum AX4]EAL72474.1 hypothetical protein DDB_G0270248 [Dictyostelium discoideum AX4]|eukprot:XP_646651.1 hypothetical protein DDB_G0270248 [Dictyostelium discoideum AX4]